MSSEEISTIAVHPFVRKFVFSIIRSIQTKNLSHEERHIIHADLVPKVSEKVMRASLGERVTPRYSGRRNMHELVAPIPKPRIMRAPAPPSMFVRQVIPSQSQVPPVQPIVPPVVSHKNYSALNHDFGKIVPLLNDPSVSTIECQGVGKPIVVIRSGQKQMTKIVLSADDIKKFLKEVSSAAHIPLLEGVFRAAVDNFSINAVISEMIGSRFIIKKQTAYSMLER